MAATQGVGRPAQALRRLCHLNLLPQEITVTDSTPLGDLGLGYLDLHRVEPLLDRGQLSQDLLTGGKGAGDLRLDIDNRRGRFSHPLLQIGPRDADAEHAVALGQRGLA